MSDGVLIILGLISEATPVGFGKLGDLKGYRNVLNIGLIITAAGNIPVALLGADSGLAHVIVALCLMGVGIGPFSAPNNKLIMPLSPQ
ncbi:MAG: hypothetical protein WCW53_01480 [Syntrophales bacterium]